MSFFSRPPRQRSLRGLQHVGSQPQSGAAGSQPQVGASGSQPQEGASSQQDLLQLMSFFSRPPRQRFLRCLPQVGSQPQSGAAGSQPQVGATGSQPQVASAPQVGSQQLRLRMSRWRRSPQHEAAGAQPHEGSAASQQLLLRTRSNRPNALALDAEARIRPAHNAGRITRDFMERAPHNQNTHFLGNRSVRFARPQSLMDNGGAKTNAVISTPLML